jgi:hypothetical protein
MPVEFHVEGNPEPSRENLKNVSMGGLCFLSKTPLEAGTPIRLSFPHIHPGHPVHGVVTWSRPRDGRYEVGVDFKDAESEFMIRMVEQACCIEHYKREVLEKEGRRLDGKQAALEWIRKFAGDFPE